jgi:hypothetical protein
MPWLEVWEKQWACLKVNGLRGERRVPWLIDELYGVRNLFTLRFQSMRMNFVLAIYAPGSPGPSSYKFVSNLAKDQLPSTSDRRAPSNVPN